MVNLSDNLRRRLPATHAEIVRQLSARADASGLSLYLVGGLVRDALIDYPNLDLDFTIEGDALSFAEQICAQENLAIKRYPEFGTATLVFSKRIRVDLAQTRKESYPVPAGLPKVSPGSIVEDLIRRDFTINSMAVKMNSTEYGELLDPSNGLKDLENGVIRVHHTRSFVDDPTRIFRAFRFETRYGFKIDAQTLTLMRDAVEASLVEELSPARVKNELIHILEDLHPREALLKLEDLGVLRRIHRRLSVRKSTDLMEDLQKCPELKRGKTWLILMLALLYRMKLAHSLEIARNLAFTRREVETVLNLHALKERLSDFPTSPSGVYRLASGLPRELLVFIMAVAKKDFVRAALQRYLSEYRFVKLEVNGHDLKSLGIEEGPIYGEVLSKALDAKLDRGLCSKEDELRFIKEYLGIDR